MSTEETDIQEEFFGHEHITVIEPQKGWRSLDLNTAVTQEYQPNES